MMKKFLLAFAILSGGSFVMPTQVYADTVIESCKYVFTAQSPTSLATVYLFQLTRDNRGNLYCYSKDNQGQYTIKRKVYRVPGTQNGYYVIINNEEFHFKVW